jgi:hypothetical protein
MATERAVQPWWVIGVVVAAGLVVAAGVGFGSVSAGAVAGKVSYRGVPMAAGTVLIEGADGIARTAAIENGRYAVPNVPTGPCKVAVLSVPVAAAVGREASKEPHSVAPRPRTQAGSTVRIPERYADPGFSGLKCDVGRGETTYDIELK